MQGIQGIQGEKGAMGRNFYFNGYSGNWQDEIKKFVVTDYETPFLLYDNTYWVWVGANGEYLFNQDNVPSQGNPNWRVMVTDFEYLITKAIFSQFAQLGSWIFNEDYMYSDQGNDSNGNETSFSDGGRYYGDGNEQNTYLPNTIFDARQGRIWTKGITLEGVVNNMIQNITSNTIGNYGRMIDGTLHLNPLTIGTYVKIDLDGGSLTISLPTAHSPQGYHYNPSINGILSLDELRQCVGKKIYFIPTEKQVEIDGEIIDKNTLLAFTNPYSLIMAKTKLWVRDNGDTADFSTANINEITNACEEKTLVSRTQNTGYRGSQYMYIIECKVGRYNDHECIYWELEMTTEALREE
jgi:hypothetical protein